jgi:Leucine-rich repeat (LRR) protein
MDECIHQWPKEQDEPKQRASFLKGLQRTIDLNHIDPYTVSINVSVSMCCGITGSAIFVQCSHIPTAATATATVQVHNVIQQLKMSHIDLSVHGLADSIFKDAINLSDLYVRASKMPSLPRSISNLTNLIRLDMIENELSSLPSSISALANLRLLDLSDNKLSSLPSSISHLTNLNELVLDGNELSSLPSAVSSLTQLTYLDLGNNKLSSFPPSISHLTNLTTLNLRNNKLSSLPPSISQLVNLNELDVSDNQLSSLSPSIASLTHLKLLYLYSNQLSSFPPSISSLTLLRSVDLSSNQIRSLPQSISSLTHLQALDMSENNLSSLPSSISKLSNMETFDVSSNEISSLPSAISHLTKLIRLDVSRNKLSSLPRSISNLAQLDAFDCSDNELSSLPSSISHLTNLTDLAINNNKISSWPPPISSLSNLNRLDVGDNQLSSLPPSISNLTQLSELYLSNNKLSSLPPSISRLTGLQYVDLDGNKLSSLPSAISSLTNLIELYLSDNELLSLPLSISSLVQLNWLDLSHNKLSSVPSSISSLTNLIELDLRSNKLSSMPSSISGLTTLNRLELSGNELLSLPSSISKLTNLNILSVSNNSLSTLPELPTSIITLNIADNQFATFPLQLLDLANMQTLNIAFNHLSVLDESVASLKNLRYLNATHNRIQYVFDWWSMELNVLDLSHNVIEFIPTVDALSAQPRFVYLSHNLLQDFIITPPVSRNLDEHHPRLRVLDLSCNQFGQPSLQDRYHLPSSWSDLSEAFQTANVDLLNLTGNPKLSFGFQDTIPKCGELAGARRSTDTGTASESLGCFVFAEATETAGDADRSVESTRQNSIANSVQCVSIFYYGAREWALTKAFSSTGRAPPQSGARILADDSMVTYATCTIAQHAYPMFLNPAELETITNAASGRLQLSIPVAWYDKSGESIVVAAPRCPDIGYELNACGEYGDDGGGGSNAVQRQSINPWSCALDGHDPHSFMCSRCVESQGYIKEGQHCRLCGSASAWIIPTLLVIGMCGFIVYVMRYADATSYMFSSVLFHLQMLAFLSRGPISWSKFAHDYFLNWVHVSNVDTTSLGCLWPSGSQEYRSVLISSLLLPVVLCVVFSLICYVFKCASERTVQRAERIRGDWHELLRQQEEPDGFEENQHRYHQHQQHGAVTTVDDDDMMSLAAITHDHSPSGTTIHPYSKEAAASVTWWKLNLYALSLLYGPLTLHIMQAFGSYDISDVNGNQLSLPPRLAIDLNVEYRSSEWNQTILPFAILGVLLYVIGIPVVLYTAVHGYLGPFALKASAFLTRVYQPGTTLLGGAISQSTMALWILLSKGALALLVALVSRSSVVPLLFVVVLLLLMLLVVTRGTPFLHDEDNTRSYVSFATLVATYSGAAMLTEEDSQHISKSQHLVLSWLIVCGNIVFLCWTLVSFFRQRRRQRSAIMI